jgi:hypothetical protein
VTIISRPVIPVRLIGPAGSHVFHGLLDTGADETFITREMADVLGVAIKEDAGYDVMSASGDMAVRCGKLSIQLSQGDEEYRWPLTAGVVDRRWREAILGHAGFLEYFDATFLGAQGEVVLTRNSSALPRE